MGAYEVKAPNAFWQTLVPLKRKYTKSQMVEIIGIVKDCIRELQEKGFVDENGWSDHLLTRSPFNDGCHFEFHIFDDDVLVVYFKIERNRRIRMVGVYDHATIPAN